MSTVKTFVRFGIAALFVNVLAVGCQVSSSDDDDVACDPGQLEPCECKNGDDGSKKCNASGDGFAQCVCAGGSGNEGGSGNSGGSGEGGSESAVAGSSSGGEAGGGGVANGGAPSGGAPSGGVSNGGVGGAEEQGGAGGSGEQTPLECQDPADTCEDCFFSCCDEWAACVNDETCLDQFNDVRACFDEIRMTRNVVVADLAACSNEVGTAGGAWSDGLDAKTIAMVNCLAGDPSESGWDQEASWGSDSCNEGCFKHE